MATITWIGEPTQEDDGPNKVEWNKITFRRGEPVEVTNEHMIAKARSNPLFTVDGDAPAEADKAAGPVVLDKTQLSEMNVAELREVAAARGIEVEGLTKAEIREKLAEAPAV